MRIFTLIATHSGGSLPDGSAAPDLPQSHAVPVAEIKALSLMPTFTAAGPDVIDGQQLVLQFVGGSGLSLTINRAPNKTGNREKMEQKFKSLLADLADDGKQFVEWQYEELS